MVGRSIRWECLPKFPQCPIELPCRSAVSSGTAASNEFIDCANRCGTDLDFLRGAGGEFLSCVDAGGEMGMILESTVIAENLG